MAQHKQEFLASIPKLQVFLLFLITYVSPTIDIVRNGRREGQTG